MKIYNIILFLITTAFSLQSFGLCYERYYSQEHLDKHKKQEIRTILIDEHSKFDAFDGEREVRASIHFKRDGKDLLAQAKGTCKLDDRNSLYQAKEGEKVHGTCLWNNQAVSFRGTVKLGFLDRELSPILFKVSENFEYDDISKGAKPGAKVFLTEYDNNFLVHHNAMETNLGGYCESTLHMAHKASAPRFWNEAILHSVRNDLARPTVTARNLFHLSILMWDIYASYSDSLKGYYFTDLKTPANEDTTQARNKSLSFAAHTLLKERYKEAPGNKGDRYPEWDATGDGEEDNRINLFLDRALQRLGYQLNDQSKEAKFGRKIAKDLIAMQLNDGSRETENYAAEDTYILKNSDILDISQSGFKTPLAIPEDSDIFDYARKVFGDYYKTNLHEIPYELQTYMDPRAIQGNDFSKDVDIDAWLRLHIPGSIDQGGNAQASEQSPLTLFWGRLPTFGSLEDAKSSTKEGVYFDPGKHLPLFTENPDEVIKQNLQVIEYSALLNPRDMSGVDFDRNGQPDSNPGAELIDISPKTLGNNNLGTNDGNGYAVNPATNKPYKANMVKAADYYRSIAEFWADGPDSETPPGHWNTLANYTVDQMKKQNLPFKFFGEGDKLSREEYELKLYLSLNGALHDAAVVAWGIKGHYQGNRPVTVIRKLAAMAESDPQFAEKLMSFSPNLKMVTYNKKTLSPDGKIQEEEVKKLAIKAWRGLYHYGFYFGDFDGGGNVELRDLSFKLRDEKAIEETNFFRGQNHAGVGWILAENWLPYQRQTFVTPPFPGFVSGHSTFSRAAAEILAGVTGSPYFPGGLGTYKAPKLHFEYDQTQDFEFQWATYFDASDVSGISRIYGGIHASYDDLPARVIGSKVGKRALKKAKDFFNQ